jgi:hypothetical protein
MKLALFCLSMVMIVPGAASACMRPQLDERAVQWSSAIVEARLTSSGPDVKIGEVQQRQGALGVLGNTTTSYFYRVYQFQVSRVLDGSLKKGQSFPVIRLFSQAEAQGLQPPGGCGAHLTGDGVGKDFLLLLTRFSDFKAIVPNGLSPPDVKGAMWIVHLDLMDSLAPGALSELQTTIASVQAARQQATPQQIDHLIGQIAGAVNDTRAGPSVRALERIGPSVVPSVQKAIAGQADGQARNRLNLVIVDLTPPEPIVMIEARPRATER